MRYFVILLILTGFVTLTPQAFACSCAIWDIEDDYKEKDNVIFSGTVANITEQQRNFLVTFEIEQSWKGIPDDVNNINIMTANNSAACGYNFTDQKSYLVVAYGSWEQTPVVSSCDSTTPLDSAHEQISFLNKQAKNIVGNDSVHIPPLKQYSSGVPFDEIQCNKNLVLVQKYDGTPACVMESTKQKLNERGWIAKIDTAPEPPIVTDVERNVQKAKEALETAYYETVNIGTFYIKDVIVGFGTHDNRLVIDIPAKYIGTKSMDVIKQDIRHIVGNDVPIDYVLYDEPIERHISTAIPYLWNHILHQKGIEFMPKNQTYLNHADGFADHDKVCSPIITSDETELYISSTFDLEPFQITGTQIDKTEPDDCHKTWKTDVIMPEPDRVTALWLKNQIIADNGSTAKLNTNTIPNDSDIQCKGSKMCLTEEITRIIDGDTIYLKGDYKIRLSLTNTPERHEIGFHDASKFTAEMCPVGTVATVDQDDMQPYDVYERVLGKVTCGGKVLNSELLYAGHANILTKYCTTSEFSGEAWAQEFGCQ